MPKNCLVVIDMQNDFLDRIEGPGRERLILNTNRLIERFRSAACPIIWIQQTFRPDLGDASLIIRDRQTSVVIEGTVGAAIDSMLDRQEDDLVINKKRYSAFFGTDLGKVLRDLAPDRVTLAGVNTHACIRTTAIDAFQRDLRVLLAAECIDSYDREHARISMNYMDGRIAVAMTNEEISNGAL